MNRRALLHGFLFVLGTAASGAEPALELGQDFHYEDADFLESGDGIAVSIPGSELFTKAWFFRGHQPAGEWVFHGIYGHVVRVYGDGHGKVKSFALSGDDGSQTFSQVYEVASAGPRLTWDTRGFPARFRDAEIGLSDDGLAWTAFWFDVDEVEVASGVVGSYVPRAVWNVGRDLFDYEGSGASRETSSVYFVEPAPGHPALLLQWEGRLALLREDNRPEILRYPAGLELGGARIQPHAQIAWFPLGLGEWFGLSYSPEERDPIWIRPGELGIPPIMEIHTRRRGNLILRTAGSTSEETHFYELKMTPQGMRTEQLARQPRTAILAGPDTLVVVERDSKKPQGDQRLRVQKLGG